MTDPSDSFSDELLSSVLDGMADPETVASVAADSEASRRLEAMRQVSQIVGTPPPEAAADRRAQSIAAALAAAPTVEGVTSLATARQAKVEKRRGTTWQFPLRWAAAAAAAVALAIGIPAAFDFGSDADIATSSDATTTTADAGGDFDESFSAAESDDAMEDSAGSEGQLSAADRADSETAAVPPETTAAADSPEDAANIDGDSEDGSSGAYFMVENADALPEMIDAGQVLPRFTADDPEVADVVSPECLEPYAGVPGALFDIVVFVEDDGAETPVLVVFDEGEFVEALEAEDCSPFG